MTKRKIVVEIETDFSGEICSAACPFLIGDWCDAYRISLPRHSQVNGRRTRSEKCRDAEIISKAKIS